MRQLPLYLKLQQLLDGELPEEQYRDMTDLDREFRDLDEIDQQKAEASDEDLELDGLEEGLMATGLDEDTDMSSLIDRKSELEAQLFGDADAPWNDNSDDIQPLRELIESLTNTTGDRGRGGRARPRLERLLRAVEELDPEQKPAPERVAGKSRTPGTHKVVAARRRQLLAEFRSAWKEALSHGPDAESAGPEVAAESPAASSQPARVATPDSTTSAAPVKPQKPPAGTEVPDQG